MFTNHFGLFDSLRSKCLFQKASSLSQENLWAMVESSAVNSNFQYGVISEHKDEEIKKYSAWEEKTAVQIRFTIGGLALGKFIAQNDKVIYI